MLTKLTIPARKKREIARDHRALFELGLSHVQRLSRRVWTDFNVHDPGVTTLELLAYAITDLSYRASLPVEDLLASGPAPAAPRRGPVYTPREVLPNAPLTRRDYRKLLLDLVETPRGEQTPRRLLRNAWILPTPWRVHADTVAGKLQRDPSDQSWIRPVDVQGLYRVDFEPWEANPTVEERARLRARVMETLAAHRNLCEDFVDADVVEAQPYALCAEIELEKGVTPEDALAAILLEVDRYLAPPVTTLSLSEILARPHPDGRARTVDEVFTGPPLRHGFFDDDELDASRLRAEIRLSDVISAIQDVPGVRAVDRILLNALVRAGDGWKSEAPADPWVLKVPERRRATLDTGHLRVLLRRGGVPLPLRMDVALAKLKALLDKDQRAIDPNTPIDLPAPGGARRRTGIYTSFQNHFPAVYGVGPEGLPSDADDERRDLARQWKGYLLFFDQVMADYLAGLLHLRDLFSTDERLEQACFHQVVDSLVGFDEIYAGPDPATALADALSDRARDLDRRGRFLDHLIARFAETFHDYVLTIQSLFDASASEGIRAKALFLQRVPEIGAARALGHDASLRGAGDTWNTLNVSGFERRVGALLGLEDLRRRNLSSVAYDLYAELDTTPGDEHRFRVRSAETGKILLSSSRHYRTEEDARAELRVAIERAKLRESYRAGTTSTGPPRHYFNVVDETGEVVARRIEYFPTPDEMERAIDEVIAYVRARYSGEGMFVIENLLLRPAPGADGPYLPICPDPNCADCAELDPYSWRLHIVLPAYGARFGQEAFRAFVERTLRAECPAHLLPKICWVDQDDMAAIEGPYRAWMESAEAEPATRDARLRALIEALYAAKSTYPSRNLRACGGEDPGEPFVLDRTSLGATKSR